MTCWACFDDGEEASSLYEEELQLSDGAAVEAVA